MHFERDIIVFLQSFSTPFLDGVFKVMSYFFDYPLVILIGLILLILKRYRDLVYFLTLEGVGLGVQLILKAIISRPRPYLTYVEILNILPASNSSFPSGHSITCMMAVIMLFVIIKNSKLTKNKKIILNSLLGLLLLLCMVNRMYLGQHYLTDILGAYLIALVIGMVIIKVFYLKKEGKIKAV